MHRKHRSEICVIATLSVLCVVFSFSLKPLENFELTTLTKKEQICSAVPTGSSVLISKMKPRIPGGPGGSSDAASVSMEPLSLQHHKELPVESELGSITTPKPKWLLHRALLI